MRKPSTSNNPQELLRSHGLRVTPQRMAIAELLLAKPVHVTPQEVYEKLKDRLPSLSPNTIYLTLTHFEEAGIVQRLHVGGRTIFDSNTVQHDHAYCHGCGSLVDVPGQRDHTQPSQLSRWRVKGEYKVWYGLCPTCLHGDSH